MGSNVSEIKIPTGFIFKDVIEWGTSGLVFLDSATKTIVKSPHSADDEPAIEIERNIYERFTQRGGHAGLLLYFGPFETGIRLEFAKNKSLLTYIQEHESNIGLEQQLGWCEEISSTLSFIHANGVIHGDLKCNNIFVDDTLHTKVADFSGSSLDGSKLLVMVTASHRSPGVLKSPEADIFALASCFYEILTGQAPYAGRDEEEIMDLYSQSKFPETTSLGPMSGIIEGCWQGKFTSANEVLMRIKGLPFLSLAALLCYDTNFTSNPKATQLPPCFLHPAGNGSRPCNIRDWFVRHLLETANKLPVLLKSYQSSLQHVQSPILVVVPVFLDSMSSLRFGQDSGSFVFLPSSQKDQLLFGNTVFGVFLQPEYLYGADTSTHIIFQFCGGGPLIDRD
jgi:serine/threonine protein kinase